MLGVLGVLATFRSRVKFVAGDVRVLQLLLLPHL